MDSLKLPPLPPAAFLWDRPEYPHFTADQLRAYGLACHAAALEAAAKKCENAHPHDWPFLAAAIRSMPVPGESA